MTAPRLAWLDGLRAVAVLLVVYAHLTRFVFTDLRAVTGEWLHAGPAGVMLFFLVSGYIIPASLERHTPGRDEGGYPACGSPTAETKAVAR
ncbi:acyltransferase family protein, partial [Actinoplanes philippinensis]|uniref:acyltransferase family protein n=1 Tax=Actinoplanes philippinensis TaxID=35752 RepID=UPI0033D22933